jgi:glycosyltransferase involved in cell wall biosynthesis
MTSLPVVVLVVCVGLCLYTYVGYPVILALLGRFRRLPLPARGAQRDPWPVISIVIPVHNEAAVIADTLERILALDYPPAHRQTIVVSDASTDGTDEIVTRFATRGVELLRLPERRGKTGAENAARPHLIGDIVINTDASVRIDMAALKYLVAAFVDPSVGVASGRDVSVSNIDDRANPGEQAYVGYDMWVRDLETRVSGIVGASGCLYAIRRHLHLQNMPDGLSRDFGSALVAREHGYRAVSVPAAVCYVPRIASLRREYRRKVRTMARGLRTLWYKRALLNPGRHGLFAWTLWSHKLCRWLAPWAALPAVVALAILAPHSWWAGAALGVGLAASLAALIGWVWPEQQVLPRLLAVPTYAVAGNIAVLQAWIRALGRQGTALWEPTRRGVAT